MAVDVFIVDVVVRVVVFAVVRTIGGGQVVKGQLVGAAGR
jgi:hypothetical protein